MRQSLISRKPLHMLDTQIEIQENQHLSLEDALDLMLCMSYNAFNSEIKER